LSPLIDDLVVPAMAFKREELDLETGSSCSALCRYRPGRVETTAERSTGNFGSPNRESLLLRLQTMLGS
jgi:hypothetical protein